MKHVCRVLIADDSQTLRTALAALLATEGLDVVGQARDGQEALELARQLRPDVITMDVRMPRMDGMTAIAAIMEQAPSRILVVCAVTEEEQLDLSFRAMQAGALEVIAKPGAGAERDLRRWGAHVAESVRLMAEVPVVTRRARGSAPCLPPVDPWVYSGTPRRVEGALGLAASTGGPTALVSLLQQVGPGLPVPVVVAQHMAPGFTAGLARWIAGEAHVPVHVAPSGTVMEAGHVYLPPDGLDLEVQVAGVLWCTPSPGGSCPSADRLLESLARACGTRAVGVVLTGMGEDGTRGLLAIRRGGGTTLAQDPATSVVFGMPQAAIQAGAAQHVASLPGLAAHIRNLFNPTIPARELM